VRWIFARRLAGHGVAAIGRSLNEMGAPCPSSVDPDRNRHRSGEAWTLRTVAAILADPRYTGRQVWNSQPTTGHTSGAQGHADDRRRCAVQRLIFCRAIRNGRVRWVAA
jgi:site-specific DNA recombinase